MFSLDEKEFSANPNLTHKTQTLIIGRLLVVFLLLVASWVWNSGRLKLSFDNFPQGLFLVFLILVGLTIVYFFVLRLSKNFKWQIRVQFLTDMLLITWLIWRTGTSTSPYITLYIVLICVSSIFLSARGTLITAVICVFLFTVLSVLTSLSLIESHGTALETSKIIQIIAFNDVAFLVVGLLASRLSDHSAYGEKLKETTKTLANLRVLHERIIESIRSGLITIDLDGKIYTFNRTAAEITGHKAESMRGKSIYSLFSDIKVPIAESLEASDDGAQPPRFETDCITHEGFVMRVGYGISSLFSEDGETTGLVITFRDLTEILSMEENVRRKDRLAAVGRVAAALAPKNRLFL
ncbi:MAG: PAS domain S-box protein [Acidobacteriota bacterium]|nr:PAS domain S-box protein [Acidobacteriota bacterium]